MAMSPVITSIIPPYIRGASVQIIGQAFGRVSSVALVDTTTLVQYECWFQVDTGYSIHFTMPTTMPDGTYTVTVGTIDNEPCSNTSGQVITLPDDSPPVPFPDSGWSQENPLPSTSLPPTPSPAYSAILARARLEAGDFAETFLDTVTTDGTTNRFDLTVESVDDATLSVILTSGGTSTVLLPASGTTANDYSLDDDQGVITLTNIPASGSILTVSGTHWQFFTDTEWLTFITSAALKHTHHLQDETAYRGATGLKFYTMAQQTIDTLPPVEYHPLALLASLEALWVIATDASFDINVATAEGTSLPREQRFSNLLSIIQAKSEQYEIICRQLGVGLDRIEVFTLRRVSRTTNRLVPVYREKEYDDYSVPERIYVHRDSGRTANDEAAPDPYFSTMGGIFP